MLFIYITEAPFWVDQQNPLLEGVQVWQPMEDQLVDFKIGENTGAAVSSTKLWGYDMLFFISILNTQTDLCM